MLAPHLLLPDLAETDTGAPPGRAGRRGHQPEEATISRQRPPFRLMLLPLF